MLICLEPLSLIFPATGKESENRQLPQLVTGALPLGADFIPRSVLMVVDYVVAWQFSF
jgi:hypothetical protein